MMAWRLAWLRVRRGATGLGSAAMFIAAVQMVIVLVYSAQATVESQAVSERLSALPSDARWVSVSTSSAEVAPEIASNIATATVRAVTGTRAATHLVFGPLSDRRGGRYQLAASDALRGEFKLTAGRWPSACGVQRCEVLAVGTSGSHIPAGLAITGRAEFRGDAVTSFGFDAATPVLIAADPLGLVRNTRYIGIPHTLQWISALDVARINHLGIASYIATIVEASNHLALRDARLVLSAPTTQLAATAAQVNALQGRMLGLALCLIMIALYAAYRIALAQRPDHAAVLQLSREYEWSASHRAWFGIATSALISVSGVVLGGLIGTGIGALVFGSRGTPPLALWWWSAGIGSTALLLLFGALHGNATARAAVLAIYTAVWLAAARVAHADVAVLVLSAAGTAIAIAVARLPQRPHKSPFTRNVRRANQARFTALAVVTGFLVAFASASLSSLAMLQQGVRDSAVFSSPLATRIAWGDRLPLQAASLREYAADRGRAFGVRKVTGAVRESLIEASPIQLLAVSPQVWQYVPELQGQAGISNDAIARATRTSAQQIGMQVRDGASFSGRVQGLDSNVGLAAWLLDDDGEASAVPISVNNAGRFALALHGVALLGFALDELPQAAVHRAHAVGEGTSTLVAPHGDLQLSNLRIDGLTASMPNSSGAAGTLRWSYALVGGSDFLPLTRAPQVLHAVVDPATAALADHGIVTVRVSDDVAVAIAVAGVANRLPTAGDRFALVDGHALAQLLAATAPSLLRVSEVWTTTELPAERRVQLTGLTITVQRETVALRAASSATQWSQRTLVLLIALVVALYFLFSLATLREIGRHAEIAGWTAQGASEHVMLRSIRTSVFGALARTAGAVLVGVAPLTPLVLGRSNIDIAGNTAVPPLHASASWVATASVLMCALMLALAAAQSLRLEDAS